MSSDITQLDCFPQTSEVVITLKEAASYIYFIREGLVKKIYTDSINRKLIPQSIGFTKDGKQFITEFENKIILFNSQAFKIAEYDNLKKKAGSAKISQDGSRIMFITEAENLKYIYTPEKILNWLKTAPIAPLSVELKSKYFQD